MLTSEVITSKSIASVAENNASNDIPFLGLNWFPEKKTVGLDLKWIKTANGLPVTLKPSNFDTIPTLRAREGLKTEKTQMAFFRESMQITEEDEQDIMRINNENDPYLKAAVDRIYDDTTTLVRGAEVVPEIMRMSLLATTDGHPVITLSSDGVQYSYDYDPNGEYAANNYAKITTATLKWDDTTNSRPITDLINAKKALRKKGKIARYALMNSNTFDYLIENAQVRNNLLAQNVSAVIEVTDDNVKAIVKARTGLDIVIYDKMYKDYQGNEVNFYPDNKVTLLPESPLGDTYFGTTPEERTASQVADVDVTTYGTGIAVAVKVEYGPPAKTLTTVSEIVLPSYEGMDSTFVLEVA